MTFVDGLGVERPYFHHDYNVTYDNERAIEVPLAMDFISRFDPTAGLELGNVLSHYVPVHWTVVDKYEQADGVINCDVMDWVPTDPVNWIVAISTVEHIGWDEEPRDATKAVAAIDRMWRWLTPGGKMLLTVPMGHNDPLDLVLLSGIIDADVVSFYERKPGNRWALKPPRPVPYDRSIPSANAIWVGEFWA